ncbi:restriction endonuclease subunit S [Stenotrophomonas pictorum]|nr:restriction endonuclease subunit S [Stenotrophomonas pictorum]
MSDSVRTIRDIAIGVYDGPHATPELHEEGAAVFLGIPNISADGRIDLATARWVADRDLPRWNRRVTPQANDIVFTYEATLNRYAIIPDGMSFTLGRRTALIRPDPEKIDYCYLFYYFFAPRWRAQIEAKTMTGATVDRIPLTNFPGFEIFVPSLGEQRRIAAVLFAYDDLIATNQRRIALLEDAARRLYREWFVHLRFPGHETVTVVDGVPEGWARKTLGQIAPLKYGRALKATERKDGQVPVYGSSGVVGNHDRALVDGGAIVVGRKGNVGSLYFSPEPCFPIDTVFFIDPEASTFYLLQALSNLNFISSDAAVPGLNRNYAHLLSLLVPAGEVAASFETLVAPLYSQAFQLERQKKKLARARDALLPKLMSGQLDVSGIPLPQPEAA